MISLSYCLILSKKRLCGSNCRLIQVPAVILSLLKIRLHTSISILEKMMSFISQNLGQNKVVKYHTICKLKAQISHNLASWTSVNQQTVGLSLKLMVMQKD